MAVEEVWVGRVDVASLHPRASAVSKVSMSPIPQSYSRNKVRDKFVCWVHGVLEEVHDDRVESFA